ncbi:Oxysterol-binding protein-domain-containing protein [Lipomyces orientalis]|uniref:Oxysterol-binding protein-domain-containing protein n=1 Tax=Lipomyces orientalis TaxID=1233043 RepID=A0ACC3TDT7_9ASCO
METLEIHSKAFLIKWILVPDNCSIQWQLKPNKKSINFGIFRRPAGAKHTESRSPLVQSAQSGRSRSSSVATVVQLSPMTGAGGTTSSTSVSAASFDEKLVQSGLHPVYWLGKCHANVILKGSYIVASGSGGMFAFVFDNTFSKTLSKTVQFAQSILSVKDADLLAGRSTTTVTVPPINRNRRKSVVPGGKQPPPPTNLSVHPEGDSLDATEQGSVPAPGVEHRYHSGILLKKRRKKLQGYAKRYFALDIDSGMLSYYHDVSSSLLRGSIPLAIAAVSVKPQTREIFIDSGAEIWNLRATSVDDFEGWKNALEKARTLALAHELTPRLTRPPSPSALSPTATIPLTDKDWSRMETIGERLNEALVLSRKLGGSPYLGPEDPARGSGGYFAFDAMVEHISLNGTPLTSAVSSPATSAAGTGTTTPAITPAGPLPSGSSSSSSTVSSRRHPFWRKKSRENANVPLSQNSHSHGGASPVLAASKAHVETIEELQRLLEQVTGDYSSLLKVSRRRSFTSQLQANVSQDGVSVYSDSEFFDAEENPAILILPDNDDVVEDIVVVSDDEDEEARSSSSLRRISSSSSSVVLKPLSPNKAVKRDLYPLPISAQISRRTSIPPNSVLPPSLIQFVRKNVGKDLSTIAMPVTANEPLSLLQRYAETMEYCSLLDSAAKAPVQTGDQILYIAAFAISCLSNTRSKDRALRKPFNPLLNETFELVREDLNFRFIAEKISHRPPVMATYAESDKWTYSYCPQPAQKFWGKSAEIISEGPITISIEGTDGETTTYSYVMPTTYLRNVLAGEKYVEPAGQVTIIASSGHKAVVEYKSKSIFSGQRAEEIAVKFFKPQNKELPIALQGKWTTELIRSPDNKLIWESGTLLPEPRLHYGMPSFCAPLNQITDIEKGKLAPTDSRLRPDQRRLEEGKIDEAEELKKKLEEFQREKRKQGKIVAEGVSSVWFRKIEDGVWVPIQGENGYWESRKRGDWNSCPTLW